MKRSDIAAMWDSTDMSYNSGFIVVKPTRFSFSVYRLMQQITNKSKDLNDQQALIKVISRLKSQNSWTNVGFLDKHVYACGKVYFESMRRLLPISDDPCSSINKINCSVLVVHNNWIYSKEAKIYRFREHLMWLYDEDDQYYSSKTRKYLTYANSRPSASNITLSLAQQKELTNRQVLALRTALTIGNLLNRAVILPIFYCATKAFQCPLNSFVHIRTFDTFFSKQYRESSFLQHPRVPDAVKQNISDYELVIHTTRSSFADTVNTITSHNLRKLFKNSKDSVINYGILDRIQVIFSDDNTGVVLNEIMRRAIRMSDYRQQKVREF